MTLLHFIIDFGSKYVQGNDSSGFWRSLLGAFIGSATSLTVFYLGTWREKRKERRIKAENDLNTLKYFELLLKNAISFAEKQRDAYQEHSKSLKEKPLEYNLLRIIVVDDLFRLLNKFNHERIFHAYVNRFGNDETHIGRFQKIFSKLDFLYRVYEAANKLQEEYIEDLTKKMIDYKDIGEEQTLVYAAIVTGSIKKQNPEFEKDAFYIMLNTLGMTYHKNAPSPKTIKYLQEKFIDPLKVSIMQNFKDNEDAMKLAYNCRKATWLYNDIIKRSESMADNFNEEYLRYKEAIDELKGVSNDLI
ncbi:MAG TPA: hypothetical protein VK806_05950 [Bacteroidia bacterium]|jgi:hypothetical protein|nr:hypothetical protein [Bacteroidia bacterium]